MKIRTKLLLGFAVVLGVMFALAAVGISRFTDTQDSIREVYDNRYKKVQFSTKLYNEAAELAKATSNLLLAESPKDEANSLEKIRTIARSIEDRLQKVHTLFDTEEGRRIGDEMTQYGSSYLQYTEEAIALYIAGNKAEANGLRETSGAERQGQFMDSVSRMIDFQDRAMDEAVVRMRASNEQTLTYTGWLTASGLMLGIAIMYWIVWSIGRGLRSVSGMIAGFASGQQSDSSYRVQVQTNDEFGQIGSIFNQLADDLERFAAKERALNKQNEEAAWTQTHLAQLLQQMHEAKTLDDIGRIYISELSRIVGAHSAAVYAIAGEPEAKRLELIGAYSRTGQAAAASAALGEGWIGQCALDGEPIRVMDVPPDYLRIGSAYGEVAPAAVAVQPVCYDGRVLAVFELDALKAFGELELAFVEKSAEAFGTALNTLQGRLRIEELLRIHQALTDELQSQSEELMSQQEELRASNEKLEEHTKALQLSEELLQRQQEELEQSNDALMRKTAELEEQVRETEEINRQVEIAKEALEKQALELAMASKYKSEFLANMSHELRTPLNSLLILSQLLKENKDGRLSAKQVEYAETIHSSGRDLLKLIDDVLDLAKVESGKMELRKERVTVTEIMEAIEKTFLPMARSKQLEFRVGVEGDVPSVLYTDPVRVQQILKNLLSNAFKFTDRGEVALNVRYIAGPEAAVAIDVQDTGIGIPKDKQDMIFEAFRQADGTTNRKYGGTGLGLSISRELAGLLGGTIELSSEEGRGSCFTLVLPLQAADRSASGQAASRTDRPRTGGVFEADVLLGGIESAVAGTSAAAEPPGLEKLPQQLQDDRERIAEGDKVLLIVEDDVHFAQILMDMARSRGFKALLALQGDTGLQLARERRPDAIILDIQLPVMDGWSVLVQLKSDAATRHIPVHVISVADEIHQGLSMGAIAWLRKPSNKESLEQAFAHIQTFLDRDLRELLIVQEDEEQRGSLSRLIAHDDIRVTAVGSGEAAIEALSAKAYDCMVLDYGLTAPTVYELLDRIKSNEAWRRLPIIIYTGKELDKKDQMRLKKYAESIIVKDVKSPERLLDETSLFLHRIAERLPEEKKRVLQRLYSKEEVFAGKKVLLVDDDIRNVFALSNLLEGLEMEVSFAENGRQAIEALQREPDFDLVLMDIMMPEMDGYEAMRAIRDMPEFASLPIIALTAKAMKDDREKCIQAGASDYIAKPVHTDQLLSLIRVWLCH